MATKKIACIVVPYSLNYLLEVEVRQKVEEDFYVRATVMWHDSKKMYATCYGHGNTAKEAVSQWKRNVLAVGWQEASVAMAAERLMEKIAELATPDLGTLYYVPQIICQHSNAGTVYLAHMPTVKSAKSPKEVAWNAYQESKQDILGAFAIREEACAVLKKRCLEIGIRPPTWCNPD